MASTLRNRAMALCLGLFLSGATVVAADELARLNEQLDLAEKIMHATNPEAAKAYLESICSISEWESTLTNFVNTTKEFAVRYVNSNNSIDDAFAADFETQFGSFGKEQFTEVCNYMWAFVNIINPSGTTNEYELSLHNWSSLDSSVKHFRATQAFKKDVYSLFSPAAYKAAWNALWHTDGVLAGLKTVWKDHKPALIGTTVVVVAAIVCRNKIKAGFNKLFGKKEQPEDAPAQDAVPETTN